MTFSWIDLLLFACGFGIGVLSRRYFELRPKKHVKVGATNACTKNDCRWSLETVGYPTSFAIELWRKHNEEFHNG